MSIDPGANSFYPALPWQRVALQLTQIPSAIVPKQLPFGLLFHSHHPAFRVERFILRAHLLQLPLIAMMSAVGLRWKRAFAYLRYDG